MRGDEEMERGKGRRGYEVDEEEEEEMRWRWWLVPVLVVANVAMFVVVMSLNNCPKQLHIGGATANIHKCFARFLGRFSFEPLRDNPLLGPSASTLLKLGALQWAKVVQNHQAWRLVSSIWLHAGVIHLLANMLSLLFIGIRLEQHFGFVRVGIIYLLSGIGGSVLSSLFIRNSISVGASGTLFGLLGAMLSELIMNWSIYTNRAAALITLLVIIAINLAIGILPHIDNFAHIGGFLAGFLLGFILLPRPQYGWSSNRNSRSIFNMKSKYKTHQYVLWAASLVLLIAGFTTGLVLLFRGVNMNNHCHWCHYLSCVPTSKWNCDSQL